MKQVIGIYVGGLGGHTWDEVSVRANGGGGSETWCVEIAAEFASRGFHVIVFGEPESWCFSPSGVEYVPYESFEDRCQYQKFDYFISSRQIDEIGDFLCCPNVYIMAHDICLHHTNDYRDLKLDRVKKIGYLSEYHKWCLQEWYEHNIPDDKMLKVSNGVNLSQYDNCNLADKTNSMVWSSRQERGLNYFVDWVFPLIRERVPDFTLNVCLYESDFNRHIDGVNFLGQIGKDELSKLQQKAKIWIYPNLGYLDTNGSPFQETYCISAVENGMAKNAIICGDNGGLQTTLKGYSNLIGEELMSDHCISGADNLKKYAQQIADEAVLILTDDAYRKSLANEAFNICKNHTWSNAVDEWLREWKIKY